VAESAAIQVCKGQIVQVLVATAAHVNEYPPLQAAAPTVAAPLPSIEHFKIEVETGEQSIGSPAVAFMPPISPIITIIAKNF